MTFCSSTPLSRAARRLLPALVLLLPAAASGEPSARPEDDRYVVLASRPDLDDAIALARRYEASVFKAKNGVFAVARGPEVINPGRDAVFLEKLRRSSEIPKDSFMARGNAFVQKLWSLPADASLKTLDFDGKTSAQLVLGDLRVAVSIAKLKTGDVTPQAQGFYRGKLAFMMRFDEGAADTASAKLQVIKLDGFSIPQVVFQHFTYGAHCCTETKIATTTNGESWRVVEAGSVDGDGGYRFEDLDGDGTSEIVGTDNSFLYAFSDYASSFAPVKVQKLVAGAMSDVSGDPRFRARLRQGLFSIEEQAKLQDDLWRSNGFLAAWVASKARLGEGPQAWAAMLKTYDRKSDIRPRVCTIAMALDKCPETKAKDVDFPEGLRAHMLEHGYIRDVALYPLP